ncbi:glycerophosphodiester phosphodiesterase family protein [Parahaliea mediterranea]|uniref:glycerophosphodiester phosphodiesterase family protein n=1 Tax=Parahaliea mediterranea TaxID=651086 RepID=UPI000E2EF376|nr:glycerophosphodiester phosphodiesterase family protein [Parahaliea mediterranea]
MGATTRFTPLAACLALLACSDASDPPPPAPVGPASLLTVRGAAAPEGEAGGMGRVVFPVFLDQPQASDITLYYRTVDGEATADEDYLPKDGHLTIAAGSTRAELTVETLGDAEPEAAERFTLALTVEGNARLASERATGTVANDDTDCSAPFSKTPNPWRVSPGSDPLNYAHRGGVIDFPENTLYAYYEVAAAGADVLEMDVYQTADNALVILHDLDVDRTTNGSGQVVDLTLAELRELDAAYWFVAGQGTPHDAPASAYTFRGIATGEQPPPPGYRAEDFRIPTLEEALQAFPHHLINIELKPDLDGAGKYEQQIAETLLRYGRTTDVIAASFVDEAANNFKAVAPCVFTSVPLDQGTGLVLGSQGDGDIPPVSEHVAFQVPPDTSQIQQVPEGFFLRVVTPDFIRDAHAANLAVQVWTVNQCEEMLEMIDLGVDAIMTDRPLLLASLLATEPGQRRCD